MPFEGNPFEEGNFASDIKLSDAPLESVLVQVRFTDVLAIRKEDGIAEFQDLLRKAYPYFIRDTTGVIEMRDGEPTKVTQGFVWRFQDRDTDDWKWRVSLEQNFIALETRAYETRGDLMERLRALIEGVEKCFDPTFVVRIGIRYVDRVSGENFTELDAFVIPEMLGVCRSDADIRNNLINAFSQAEFQMPEGMMRARWGLMPAGSTHDPSAMKPVDSVSWVLDIDSFTTFREKYFHVEDILEAATKLAKRAYTYFRWSVTEEFMKTYGAER